MANTGTNSMTKLEAWQAWCAGAGTEQLADQLTLMKSSHGKAFSYAWDAAAKAEREAIAQSLDKQADLACDEIDRQWAQEMAAAVRARGEKT